MGYKLLSNYTFKALEALFLVNTIRKKKMYLLKLFQHEKQLALS